MRKARVASCGLGSCGCASQPCTRTVGGQEPSMPPRLTETFKIPEAWQRRHNRKPSPPRRAPPPGPHLREDQVGHARKCPRNNAANPRRDLTYARSRLRTAKKGTVISEAHARCWSATHAPTENHVRAHALPHTPKRYHPERRMHSWVQNHTNLINYANTCTCNEFGCSIACLLYTSPSPRDRG